MDEKLRILLCEDDENLGMLLREYLQAKGYSTELFPDGEAGYKAFACKYSLKSMPRFSSSSHNRIRNFSSISFIF